MKPGAGRLAVQLVDGASAITSAAGRDPLKILTPIHRGPAAWACTASFGGGLVAGDHIALDIDIGADARCWCGTQASTKVYRDPEGRVARQDLAIRVAQGALLALLPDPVACFAESRYHQTITLDLAATADLVLVDAVTGGRTANGEHWDLADYDSRVELSVDGVVQARDRLRLGDGARGIDGVQHLGAAAVLATVILAGPGTEGLRRDLLERQGADGPLRWAAQPQGDLLFIRIATDSSERLNDWLAAELAGLVPQLGANPWRRKF